ncbi:MAG: Uma2 family endonuclease [Armatimonadetes bacterium]|nr:Uma2 family endonuclease [Armatimonadota bacterium]
MSIATETELLTAEEFLERYADERAELIEGRVITMAYGGGGHGRRSAKLLAALDAWGEGTGLGTAFPPETGFLLARDPDTVRVPDGAYVNWDRLGDEVAEGVVPVAPDLAVEVVSPTDRRGDVLAKVGVWLNAGTDVVIVVWPRSDRVSLYRQGVDPVNLGPGEIITVEDVLPGFSLPVDIVLGAHRRHPPKNR